MSAPTIAKAEFVARQNRVRAAAEQRGWAGVAVAGRGGGTYDRHGDLMYLSGHYQGFVYVPDQPGHWAGRGHALLVLPVSGPSRLICSAPAVDARVVADEVIVAADFTAEASRALSALGSGGFAGFDLIPLAIARDWPLESFDPAESLLAAERMVKSPAEVDVLRHACGIGSAAMSALRTALAPGVTEAEALAAAVAHTVQAGAVPYSISFATGEATYTPALARPFPGYRPEQVVSEGDGVTVDMTVVYEGYYSDFARSWVVGGPDFNHEMDELSAALHAALEAAVATALPGATLGDVVDAGVSAFPAWAQPSYPDHWGHGLGMGWEPPFLLAGAPQTLQPGMTLAIERGARSAAAGAYLEHDILVTSGQPEVLESAPL